MKIELNNEEFTLIVAELQHAAAYMAEKDKPEACKRREDLAYKLIRQHEQEAQ